MDIAGPGRAVHPHRRPLGGQAGRPAAGAQEVRRVGAALESQQVRAEQALDHLPPPGELGEDLITRERDVVKEADTDVGALFAEHPGHQLELIIVDPDRRAVSRLLGGGLREAPVHRHVGLPPVALKLRRGDDVVVQRPQRRVAEALVKVPDLRRGQAHPDQVQPLRLERSWRRPRITGPADPGAAGLAHDGFEGRHQPARAGPPARLAVRLLDPVHRQPAGHDHEIVASVARFSCGDAVFRDRGHCSTLANYRRPPRPAGQGAP